MTCLENMRAAPESDRIAATENMILFTRLRRFGQFRNGARQSCA